MVLPISDLAQLGNQFEDPFYGNGVFTPQAVTSVEYTLVQCILFLGELIGLQVALSLSDSVFTLGIFISRVSGLFYRPTSGNSTRVFTPDSSVGHGRPSGPCGLSAQQC